MLIYAIYRKTVFCAHCCPLGTKKQKNIILFLSAFLLYVKFVAKTRRAVNFLCVILVVGKHLQILFSLFKANIDTFQFTSFQSAVAKFLGFMFFLVPVLYFIMSVTAMATAKVAFRRGMDFLKILLRGLTALLTPNKLLICFTKKQANRDDKKRCYT